MEWFVKKGFTVLAPDMLGIGEMGPGVFHGDSYIQGVSYNVWFLSMLIGRSIVGIQANDVVKLVHILEEHSKTEEVYGGALKELSPLLLHAAAFDTSIRRVALIEPYSSYRSIVMNRFYSPAYLYSTVPGSLTAYDLPDLAASLAPRKLTMVDVRDGAGNPVDIEKNDEDLLIIKSAYHNQKAGDQLNIVSLKSVGSLKEIYERWIK
jgi:hypothetical protein